MNDPIHDDWERLIKTLEKTKREKYNKRGFIDEESEGL